MGISSGTLREENGNSIRNTKRHRMGTPAGTDRMETYSGTLRDRMVTPSDALRDNGNSFMYTMIRRMGTPSSTLRDIGWELNQGL
jgi:hypothetical protein